MEFHFFLTSTVLQYLNIPEFISPGWIFRLFPIFHFNKKMLQYVDTFLYMCFYACV